jgi:hypothetical protein
MADGPNTLPHDVGMVNGLLIGGVVAHLLEHATIRLFYLPLPMNLRARNRNQNAANI